MSADHKFLEICCPDHVEPLFPRQDVPFTPLRHSKDSGENGQRGSMSSPLTKAVPVRVQSTRRAWDVILGS